MAAALRDAAQYRKKMEAAFAERDDCYLQMGEMDKKITSLEVIPTTASHWLIHLLAQRDVENGKRELESEIKSNAGLQARYDAEKTRATELELSLVASDEALTKIKEVAAEAEKQAAELAAKLERARNEHQRQLTRVREEAEAREVQLKQDMEAAADKMKASLAAAQVPQAGRTEKQLRRLNLCVQAELAEQKSMFEAQLQALQDRIGELEDGLQEKLLYWDYWKGAKFRPREIEKLERFKEIVEAEFAQ